MNDVDIGTILGLDASLNYAAETPVDYGLRGHNRGEGDRMRHLILSADLTRKHGPAIANALTTGHEVSGVVRDFDVRGFSQEDKQDLMYNAMGRTIAGVTTNRREAERLAENAVKGSRLHIPLTGFDAGQHQANQLSTGPYQHTSERQQFWMK